MKAQKMTKQTIKMVQEVNKYMKLRHVKNTNDPQFSVMCWLLIKAGCYYGYNYFTVDGRLSGGDNERFDHLEIYIR